MVVQSVRKLTEGGDAVAAVSVLRVAAATGVAGLSREDAEELRQLAFAVGAQHACAEVRHRCCELLFAICVMHTSPLRIEEVEIVIEWAREHHDCVACIDYCLKLLTVGSNLSEQTQ